MWMNILYVAILAVAAFAVVRWVPPGLRGGCG